MKNLNILLKGIIFISLMLYLFGNEVSFFQNKYTRQISIIVLIISMFGLWIFNKKKKQ